MSSFFSTASTDNQLRVSPQFWIFWSFSIPLTVVVLVVYILWVQRAEVRDWYAQMRERHLGLQKMHSRLQKMHSRLQQVHSRLQKMLRGGKQREGDLEKAE